jgi:hypothetical protein
MWGHDALRASSDFLSEPLTMADFERLDLLPSTMRRLAILLESEANGSLSPLDRPELVAFKEAALHLRLNEGDV